MKLRFDANLSRKIISEIGDVFPDSAHVSVLGLGEAKDSRIWQFALDNGYTIVSKDEDFHQMSLLFGHPPKFVYLRLGNCTTREVVQLLHSYEGKILDFCRDEEASLLVLA